MTVLTIAGALTATGLSTAASAGTKKKPKAAAPATITVEKPAAANLTETGSTLLYPLWNIWGPAYHHTYPQVTLTTAGTGSGTGIADATNNTVNIGSSDAYLSPSTVAANPGLLNIPLAISYQVIAYNIPGVTAHLKLNGTILTKIYLGRITRWDDPAIAKLNPGINLPGTTIVPVHRADGSGDTFLFSQYLARQDGPEWGSGNYGTSVTWPALHSALSAQGNGGMVTTCQATPGCIAYIGISFLAQAQKAGLQYAQLLNGNGQYMMPTAQAVAKEAAQYANITPASGAISMINGRVNGGYPIINYEYGIVNKNQTSASTAQAVRSLLEWAISPKFGNQMKFLNQVNFLPLPAKVVAQSYKQIKSIK